MRGYASAPSRRRVADDHRRARKRDTLGNVAYDHRHARVHLYCYNSDTITVSLAVSLERVASPPPSLARAETFVSRRRRFRRVEGFASQKFSAAATL